MTEQITEAPKQKLNIHALNTFRDSYLDPKTRILSLKVFDPTPNQNKERVYTFDPNNVNQTRNLLKDFLNKYGEKYRDIFKRFNFPIDDMLPSQPETLPEENEKTREVQPTKLSDAIESLKEAQARHRGEETQESRVENKPKERKPLATLFDKISQSDVKGEKFFDINSAGLKLSLSELRDYVNEELEKYVNSNYEGKEEPGFYWEKGENGSILIIDENFAEPIAEIRAMKPRPEVAGQDEQAEEAVEPEDLPEPEPEPIMLETKRFSQDSFNQAVENAISAIPEELNFIVIQVGNERPRRYSRAVAKRKLSELMATGFSQLQSARVNDFGGILETFNDDSQVFSLIYKEKKQEEGFPYRHLKVEINGVRVEKPAKDAGAEFGNARDLNDREIQRFVRNIGDRGITVYDAEGNEEVFGPDEVASELFAGFTNEASESATLTQDSDNEYTLTVTRTHIEKPNGLLGKLAKGKKIETTNTYKIVVDAKEGWSERQRKETKKKLISASREAELVSQMSDQLESETNGLISDQEQLVVNLEAEIVRLKQTRRDRLTTFQQTELDEKIEAAEIKLAKTKDQIEDYSVPPQEALVIEAFKQMRARILSKSENANASNEQYFVESWGFDPKDVAKWKEADKAQIRTHLQRNAEKILSQALRLSLERNVIQAWNEYSDQEETNMADSLWNKVKPFHEKFRSPHEGKRLVSLGQKPEFPAESIISIVESQFGLPDGSPIKQLEAIAKMRDEIADTTKVLRVVERVDRATEQFEEMAKDILRYINPKLREYKRLSAILKDRNADPRERDAARTMLRSEFVSGFSDSMTEIKPEELREPKTSARFLTLIENQIVRDLGSHIKKGRRGTIKYDSSEESRQLQNLLGIMRDDSSEMSQKTVRDVIKEMRGAADGSITTESHVRQAISQLGLEKELERPDNVVKIAETAMAIADQDVDDRREATQNKLISVQEALDKLLKQRGIELSDNDVTRIIGSVTRSRLTQLSVVEAVVDHIESQLEADRGTESAIPLFPVPRLPNIPNLDLLLDLSNDFNALEEYKKTKLKKRFGNKPLFGGGGFNKPNK